MSAETLRRAADRIREVSEKAAAQSQIETRAEGVWLNSRFYMTADPDFMLAVADLLEDGATYLDYVAENHAADARGDEGQFFLAVARTYLGEDS